MRLHEFMDDKTSAVKKFLTRLIRSLVNSMAMT